VSLCVLAPALAVAFAFAAAADYAAALPYRRRLALCVARGESPLAALLVGKLRQLLSSLLFGLLTVLALYWLWLDWSPPLVLLVLFSAAATFWLEGVLRRKLERHLVPEAASVLVLRLASIGAALPAAVLFAVLSYFTTPLAQVFPTADADLYLETLLEEFVGGSPCSPLGWPAVVLKFSEYLFWSLVLKAFAFGGWKFVLASVFLLIKGGLPAWVINRNLLLIKKTLPFFGRSFGRPF